MVVEGLAAMGGALKSVEAAASVTAAIPAVESAVSMGPALGARLDVASMAMPAETLVKGMGGMNIDINAPVSPGATPLAEAGGSGGRGLDVSIPMASSADMPPLDPIPGRVDALSTLGNGETNTENLTSTDGSAIIDAAGGGAPPGGEVTTTALPAESGDGNKPTVESEKGTDATGTRAEIGDSPTTESNLSTEEAQRLADLNSVDAADLSTSELVERNKLLQKEGEAGPENKRNRYDDIRDRLEDPKQAASVTDEEAQFAAKYEDDFRDNLNGEAPDMGEFSSVEELGADAMEKLASGNPTEAAEALSKFQDAYAQQNDKKMESGTPFKDAVAKFLS
ncbi:hypothetical protein HYS00_02960, partial [Candidatus Microgenomates bacterium]|nr:hypothetical protein [Candidatus Microgenomates bacterium]